MNPLTVNPAILVQHVRDTAPHRRSRHLPSEYRSSRPDRAILAARSAGEALRRAGH